MTWPLPCATGSRSGVENTRHIYMYACVHICIHTCMHSYMHAYMYSHMCIHIHIYIYVSVYTNQLHMCIYIYMHMCAFIHVLSLLISLFTCVSMFCLYICMYNLHVRFPSNPLANRSAACSGA